VAARSKAWVCGRSLFGIAGSNPASEWMSVSCVLCSQVGVSATGRLLVKRIPTECAMIVCDIETSTEGSTGSTSVVNPQKTYIDLCIDVMKAYRSI